MRSKSVWAFVLASLTLFLVALRAAPVQAGDPKEKEVSGDGLRKQFQWEEKVLGPKDPKQIDHAKIAAMQEQARREDASRPKTAPQKATRAQGVAAPASSTLPTMDIEKAAPAGSVHYPPKKGAARAEAPKSHDAIDDFLAMNSAPEHQTVASNSASHPSRMFKSAHRKHSRRTTRVR